jgi:hypothetical protein
MCGKVLVAHKTEPAATNHAPPPTTSAPPPVPLPAAPIFPSERPAPLLPAPFDRVPAPFLHLGAGAIVAFLLHWATCGIFEMGSHCLFHEGGGHAVAAWFLATPALPKITITQWTEEPKPALFVLIWLAIGAAAWRLREKRWLAGSLGAAAVIYPFLVFTGARFALICAGGHLGEIGWAAFFFYRALRGGAFAEAERPLYAALAWPLWIQNVTFFFRLATSAKWREAYETIYLNEGVPNDFIQLQTATGIHLVTSAAVMLLLAIVVPPTGIWLGYRDSRGPMEPKGD